MRMNWIVSTVIGLGLLCTTACASATDGKTPDELRIADLQSQISELLEANEKHATANRIWAETLAAMETHHKLDRVYDQEQLLELQRLYHDDMAGRQEELCTVVELRMFGPYEQDTHTSSEMITAAGVCFSELRMYDIAGFTPPTDRTVTVD